MPEGPPDHPRRPIDEPGRARRPPPPATTGPIEGLSIVRHPLPQDRGQLSPGMASGLWAGDGKTPSIGCEGTSLDAVQISAGDWVRHTPAFPRLADRGRGRGLPRRLQAAQLPRHADQWGSGLDLVKPARHERFIEAALPISGDFGVAVPSSLQYCQYNSRLCGQTLRV